MSSIELKKAMSSIELKKAMSSIELQKHMSSVELQKHMSSIELYRSMHMSSFELQLEIRTKPLHATDLVLIIRTYLENILATFVIHSQALEKGS